MNKIFKSLLIGAIILLNITAYQIHAKQMIDDTGTGGGWAPSHLDVTDPDNNNASVELEKVGETEDTAYYGPKDPTEPDKSICERYPDKCIIVREN